MAGGGTKLPRSSPCSSSSASQAASATSVLRPGSILTCRALTSSSSTPRASSTYLIGFQYGPVASITTCVTPSAASQSANRSKSALKVGNARTSCRRAPPPGPGVRTQATTSSLATSNPAQRSTSRSTTAPPSPPVLAPQGPAGPTDQRRCKSCSQPQIALPGRPEELVLHSGLLHQGTTSSARPRPILIRRGARRAWEPVRRIAGWVVLCGGLEGDRVAEGLKLLDELGLVPVVVVAAGEVVTAEVVVVAVAC